MNSQTTFALFSVTVAFAAIVLSAQAVVSTVGEGTWPDSWPAELEPLRDQSTTTQAGMGATEDIYDITFLTRDQFESVWPVILSLKSPGAQLRRIPMQATRSGGPSERPMVRIYAPPSRGAIDLGPDGRDGIEGLRKQMNEASPEEQKILRKTMHDLIIKASNEGKHLMPGPPWPESVLTEDGEVPEYVCTKEVDGKLTWVAAESREMLPSVLYRARIEIELYFDGTIIDLKRIALPPDTPTGNKPSPSVKQSALPEESVTNASGDSSGSTIR